jgi:hypothetical protein
MSSALLPPGSSDAGRARASRASMSLMFDGIFGLSDLVTARAALQRSLERRADRSQVRRAEQAVQDEPERIAFAPDGTATVRGPDRTYHAGRFETPTLAMLRERVRGAGARTRLCVALGTDPLTDVGGLQALAPPGTLFQVASQFNCLESPGPYLVDVADYFTDPTQGPRASIGAFPGTLVRHYAAPGPDGTFVQTPARQLDLLADALPPSVARVESGYLTAAHVNDPAALLAALEERFDRIRVGVHDDVEVVLGHQWDGAVEGERRIAQVFTSTYAHGYSERGALGEYLDPVCRQLLRAAYVGTLLAAAALRKRAVVLTAIGGGVFRNDHGVIWDALRWALDEVEPVLAAPLDVVFNARDLTVPRPQLLADVRAR